jgi:hypothetical protein
MSSDEQCIQQEKTASIDHEQKELGQIQKCNETRFAPAFNHTITSIHRHLHSTYRYIRYVTSRVRIETFSASHSSDHV